MRPFRTLLLAFLVTFTFPIPTAAQEPVHWDVVARIRAEGFGNSSVAEYTSYLSDVIGPRLTASPNMRAAQQWLLRVMGEIGLEGAKLEPFGENTIGWDLERVSLHMLEPDYQMVIGYPLAFSRGTDGPVVERAVIANIRSKADLELYRGRLKNAIVLSTPMMPVSPRFVQDAFRHTDESLHAFETSGVDLLLERHGRGQPQQTAFELDGINQAEVDEFFRSEGVAAVLIASIGSDGTVAAGAVPGGPGARTREGVENSLPTLSVAAEHYNRIYRILERGIPVRLEVDVRVGLNESDTQAYNVLGEIRGGDLADEVVGLGAHLDSWHSATGATDNAAGVAVVMEAMRILKELGVTPRRTIRAMLWSYEEGGLRGSRGYVRNHLGSPKEGRTPDYDKFSVYFNMDNGTGQFRGVHLQGNTLVTPIFDAWLRPFHDLGVKTLSQYSNTGTDHRAFDEVGLPGFQFIQDRIDYRSRTWHLSMDQYDHVLPDDLEINAIVLASFAYHAAMRDELIPRKP
ncbi:MAG: M20/M25/M40 family metallo-hydrolase [Longimicrobiales bacterium]